MNGPWLALRVGGLSAPYMWLPMLEAELSAGLAYETPVSAGSLAGAAPYLRAQIPSFQAQLGATSPQLVQILHGALGGSVPIVGGSRLTPAELPPIALQARVRESYWAIDGAAIEQCILVSNAKESRVTLRTQGGSLAGTSTTLPMIDTATTHVPFASSTVTYDGLEVRVLQWEIDIANPLALTTGPDSGIYAQSAFRIGPPTVRLTLTLRRDVYLTWYTQALDPEIAHAVKIIAGAFTFWLPDQRLTVFPGIGLHRAVPRVTITLTSGPAYTVPLGFPPLTETPLIIDVEG